MSAPGPVSSQITIDVSRFHTHRVFYFDRFAIFPGDASYEFHFGFFGHSQELMQGLIAIVAKDVISTAQESFLTYIKQMGALPEVVDLPACRLHSPCDVTAADMIGLARHQTTRGSDLSRY